MSTVKELRHGTVTAYNNHRCRCEPCTKAKAKCDRASRARRRELGSRPYNKHGRSRTKGYRREKQREYYRQDPERVTARVRRSRLKRTYGITPADYEAMSAAQGHVCAICREKCKRGHRLAIDHDHATGKVRGLLCHDCNLTIGSARESAKVLRAAIDYLREGSNG